MQSPAAFRHRCRHCSKTMTVPERLRGKSMKCPNPECGRTITFPLAVAEPVIELIEAPLVEEQEVPEPQPRPKRRPRSARWPLILGVAALLLFGAIGGAAILVSRIGDALALNSGKTQPTAMALQSDPVASRTTSECTATPLTHQPSTPATIPDDPPVRSNLSEAEQTLLKLASAWHYVNRSRITGSVANYAQHLDVLKRESAKGGPNGTLANLILMNYIIALNNDAQLSVRHELLNKGLPAEIGHLALRGALAGLKNEEIPPPYSRAFRDGPAKSGLMWVDNLRSNEIEKWSLMVASGQANRNIADTFEKHFAPRLGQSTLNWDAMSPKVGMFDHYSSSLMNLIDVKYTGTRTLTNVVFVTRLETTGIRTEPYAAQQRILDLNRLTGFEDKNKEVAELFRVQNLAGSMPQAGIAYIPVLRPGDEVRLIPGNSERERLVGFSLAMSCDQGRLSEKKLQGLQSQNGGITVKPGPQNYQGPHLGTWDAIGYEYWDDKSPASLVWDFKPQGVIDVKIPPIRVEYQWKYVIDETQSPKQIDLIPHKGKQANKVLKGIYKIENDVLTVCFPRDNVDDAETLSRPTSFNLKNRSDLHILRLKRPAGR